jgi:hypothetical protein
MSANPFIKPNLILVEGPSDAAFFRHLIGARGIADKFSVRSPKDADGIDSGGNSRFGEALNAFAVDPTFGMVTEIIVVADNDSDPKDAFENVQRQIRSTARSYIEPKTPYVKARGKAPHFTALMLPSVGNTGCLETLCLAAAVKANPGLAACVDALKTCSGTGKWPASKQAKSDLRCLIASHYQRNPEISLTFVWDHLPEFIPLNDPVFDDLEKFLRQF